MYSITHHLLCVRSASHLLCASLVLLTVLNVPALLLELLLQGLFGHFWSLTFKEIQDSFVHHLFTEMVI